MHLHTLWFVIIAIFWVGFFVLEGFDFGVGMLHTIVGKTDIERRVALNTIGPWWDGNEVWLVVAGAGMFAAFPGWYGTMFSALYLALLIVLAALMARGVAFEYRGKSDNPRWQRAWRWCTTIGSLLVPLLLGIGLGDLLVGLPINSSHNYTGNFFNLLTPVRHLDRADPRCAVPAPRRDVPEAQNHRHSPRPRTRHRRAAWMGRHRNGHRLRGLDPRGRRRRGRPRPGPDPLGASRSSSPRGSRSPTATTDGPSPPRRSRSPPPSARSSSTCIPTSWSRARTPPTT